MRKLNGMVMKPNQDPNEYITEVFRQRDELEHIGESFIEARILYIILHGLRDKKKPIKFAADREPEISLKESEITIRNIYANHVVRGDCSTFSRGKGRESAITTCSGFKGSCVYYNKPGHKKAQYSKFLRESGGGSSPSSGSARITWCTLQNTKLHDNADFGTQQQQRSNGGGSGNTRGNNNHGNGNGHRHSGVSKTGRANTTVTVNGTFSPEVIVPAPAAPVTTPVAPVTAPPTPITAPPTGDDRCCRPQHAQRNLHGHPHRSRYRRPRLSSGQVASGRECAGTWLSPIFKRDGGT